MHATDPGQQGIHILEGPGDKGEETLCVFWFPALHLPDLYQVFKPLFDGFHMTEHHRGRSSDVKLVSLVHDVEPFLRAAFPFRDEAAYTVDQYFGAGAGQRVHPGFFQCHQHFAVGAFLQFGDMRHFRWPERMEFDLREFRLDGPEGVDIKLQTEIGMMPALE